MKTLKTWEVRFLWTLMLVLIGVDAFGLWHEHLSLDPLALRNSVLKFAAVMIFFFAAMRMKADARIINFLHVAAIIWAYTAITLILSYIVTAAKFPLADAWLVHADTFLGFQWFSFNTWVEAHPSIKTILNLAYDSFMPQMILLQIILNWRSMTARSWELLVVAVTSCIACIVLSGFWPALGPFDHFNTKPNAPNILDILDLRGGQLKVIGSRAVQGLVEFPSFHAASAVFYTYAARGIPDLFPFMIVLNIIMMISTLPIGGHYLADVWSGALLALAVIWVVRRKAPVSLGKKQSRKKS